jgi:4'-phosphopantetheinyl transferase
MPVTFLEWNNSAFDRHTAFLLRPDEVQVWTAIVPEDGAYLTGLAGVLDPEERQRAARFSVSLPRRQFIFGRACLRQILGACLQIDPVALVFDRQKHGKPFLSAPASVLNFNLAHSGQRIAIVLSRAGEVGVDLELIHPLNDFSLLARRIFSARELAELHSLPEGQQLRAFFNGWTRKEAWLKATGEGLIDDLPAIEVNLTPGKAPTFLGLPTGLSSVPRWSIHELLLPADYAGAVVFAKGR